MPVAGLAVGKAMVSGRREITIEIVGHGDTGLTCPAAGRHVYRWDGNALTEAPLTLR